jgi:glutathione S-transferase
MKRQAQIDCYLDWHHQNIRAGAGGTIFRTYFIKNMTGKAATPESIKESWDLLHASLKTIETIWIKGDSEFMFGD